jgi:ribosomal protein S17
MRKIRDRQAKARTALQSVSAAVMNLAVLIVACRPRSRCDQAAFIALIAINSRLCSAKYRRVCLKMQQTAAPDRRSRACWGDTIPATSSSPQG